MSNERFEDETPGFIVKAGPDQAKKMKVVDDWIKDPENNPHPLSLNDPDIRLSGSSGGG